jgi:hypothetical protein
LKELGFSPAHKILITNDNNIQNRNRGAMAIACRAMSRFLPVPSPSLFLSSSTFPVASRPAAFVSARCCSSRTFPPPDVPQLAEKARITLSPEEVMPTLLRSMKCYGSVRK